MTQAYLSVPETDIKLSSEDATSLEFDPSSLVDILLHVSRLAPSAVKNTSMRVDFEASQIASSVA